MFIPDEQKFSRGVSIPPPNYPNKFIPQNGYLCVHINCKNTDNNRQQQIVFNNNRSNNIFILKHNESIEIEIPDYCNKSENFKFAVTHYVPIGNGQHYCFANGENAKRNNFNKWVYFFRYQFR
ncbi:unnamed protein product [Meloidogyne enterolobii]|uniref:Uncharacterized protein n=2 Tax=Meloidogyne enterolobii TaxID=390850 RepID=A0ACB1AKC8_MELEN